MEYQFGSGVLFAYPVSGNLGANPTPMQFGTLQEVSLDVSFDVKQLFGRNQFPDDVAKGKGTVTGKAKFGRFNGKLLNDLFFGQTVATGQRQVVLDEAGSIPATPFQITVTGSANFLNPEGDLGVRYSLTNLPLVRVASTPAAGQYSVDEATGKYTFAAADTGLAVKISYIKTVSANGNRTDISNQLMGFGPRFEVVLMQSYNNIQENVKLYRCVATKMSRATKQDDYTIPEFEFQAFANDAGLVMSLESGE